MESSRAFVVTEIEIRNFDCIAGIVSGSPIVDRDTDRFTSDIADDVNNDSLACTAFLSEVSAYVCILRNFCNKDDVRNTFLVDVLRRIKASGSRNFDSTFLAQLNRRRPDSLVTVLQPLLDDLDTYIRYGFTHVNSLHVFDLCFRSHYI